MNRILHIFHFILVFFPPYLAYSQDAWQLGDFRLLEADAKSLEVSDSLEKNLGPMPNIDYVRRVGGVAFDSIASVDGTEVDGIRLVYERRNSDGQRLIVSLNGKDYVPTLYDWQLIPIAKYADSPYSAAFTLFGELNDKIRQQSI